MTKNSFNSGATMDTFADRFMLQIEFADKSVEYVTEERNRIYKYFTDLEGKSICTTIVLIVHQKDLDLCNNNHIHLILLTNRRMRLATMLNLFSNRFGYNPFAISIDKCVLLYGTLRYYLHMDGDVEGKHLYSLNDVLSNVSDYLLETYLDSEDDTLDAKRLIEICRECNFEKDEIMLRIGLNAYKKYNVCIMAIIDKEFKLSQQAIKRDNERLPF